MCRGKHRLSLALLPGARSSCPSEFEGAPGRPLGMDPELPGKGGEALLFLSAPGRRIRSQMFFVVGEYFGHCLEKTSPPDFHPPFLGISSSKAPIAQRLLTTLPSPSSSKKRNKQGCLPELLPPRGFSERSTGSPCQEGGV